MFPRQNLLQLLQTSCIRCPKGVALIFGQKKITYQKLWQQIQSFAFAFRYLDIKKADKVALYLGNCPEFIISYFAVTGIGAVVVPINPLLKEEEIKYILQDSGAVCLITHGHSIELAKHLRLRVDSLNVIISTGQTSDAEIPTFAQLLNEERTLDIGDDIDPEETAVILYTSGTTGRPKGAMLSHVNLVSNARISSSLIKTSPRDNFVCVLPMFHSFAWTVCVLLPLSVGSSVTIVNSARAFKRFLRIIRRNRCTVFVGIPAFYRILSELKLPRWLAWPILKVLNPVRICISGADKLPVEVKERFEKRFHIPLLEGYGLTEASPVVSLNPLRGERKSGSVGTAIPYTQVKVVDEKGRDLPAGNRGELLVKGPGLMKGYFNLSEATREAIRDGWLYTGDIAMIDAQGYIYIVDRKKDLVIVRGLNVYPREIEDLLYQHPLVKEAAVIGVASRQKGEVPKAFVVLKEGAEASDGALIRYLRKNLADYKIPHQIEFVSELPKTATGKIMKHSLKKLGG